MKHQKTLLLLFLLLFSIYVSGAITDVTLVSPSADGNYLSGEQAIVFKVTTDSASDTPIAALYYSTTPTAHSNTIESPLTLNATNCEDADFTSERICSYLWNTATAPDGNYFVDVNVSVGGVGNEKSSVNDFFVDNTSPSTNVDYNAGWTKFSNKITLTGSDNSNNFQTWYRKDTNGSDSLTFGNWTLYSAPFEIDNSVDGNFSVDFNSIDIAGKEEITKRINILIDTTAPASPAISLPLNGTQANSQSVSFTLSDTVGEIDKTTVKVDINGTSSSSFASENCQGSAGSYTCAYTESAFDTNNTDYNVTVFVSDKAGNAALPKESIFTYLDADAPAKVTGLTAAAGDGQVALNWTASTANDLNHYNVYMGTATGFTTDDSSLIFVASSGITSYTKTGLTNGTEYFFKVSAEDKSGNEGTDATEAKGIPSTTASGLSAPTILSSTHTNNEWSTNNDPEFSWANVTDATSYQCAFDHSSSTTPSANCSSVHKPSGTQNDGIWYFHLKSCNSNGCSSTSRFTVKIDRTGPAQPANFTVNAKPDGSVDIDWSAVDDLPSGDNSGVKEYKVYRRLDKDAPDGRDVISPNNFTGTSYNDDSPNLNSGVKYYYWVRAFDNVGNAGKLTVFKSDVIVKSNECNLGFSHDLASFVGTGKLEFKITSTKTMKNPDLEARVVGAGLLSEDSTSYRSTSASGTYTLNKNYSGKKLEITLTADDSFGNTCFFRETFSIDGTKPAAQWIEPLDGAELDLIAQPKLTVSASDNNGSGIEKIVFYYKQEGDFIEFGQDTSASNNEFSATLSSQDIGLGELKLKAVVFDNAGNKTEKTVSATVTNSPSGQSIYDQTEFEFELDQLEQMLQNSGLKKELVKEAREFIENNTVKREFVVIKTGEGKFKAKMVVTFVNDSGKTLDIKIVEVVPKEFAKKASLLSSAKSFVVIQEDPVIEFSFSQVAPGKTIEFEYALTGFLSAKKADALIEKNPIEEFVSPPIILNADKDLSKSFSAFPFKIDPLFVIFLLIIIVLIVLGGIVLFGGGLIFHLHRKSKRESSGLQAKIEKQGPGSMEKASEQLREWFSEKDKEERRGGRFRWKGK